MKRKAGDTIQQHAPPIKKSRNRRTLGRSTRLDRTLQDMKNKFYLDRLEWKKFLEATTREYKARLKSLPKMLRDEDDRVVLPSFHGKLFGTKAYCGCDVCNFYRGELENEYMDILAAKYNALVEDGLKTSFDPNKTLNHNLDGF